MRISDWSSDVCSSDLLLFDGRVDGAALFGDFGEVADAGTGDEDRGTGFLEGGVDAGRPVDAGRNPIPALPRSEEHTSELQSLMRITYAVFCLYTNKAHSLNASTP